MTNLVDCIMQRVIVPDNGRFQRVLQLSNNQHFKAARNKLPMNGVYRVAAIIKLFKDFDKTKRRKS